MLKVYSFFLGLAATVLFLSAESALADVYPFFTTRYGQAYSNTSPPSSTITDRHNSTFSGYSMGGSVGARTMGNKYSVERYGIGFEFSYDHVNMPGGSVDYGNERIVGENLGLVGRVYASNLFVGLGIVYSSHTLYYHLPSPNNLNAQGNRAPVREAQQKAYGVRIELGAELNLFGRFYLVPRIYYDAMKAYPESTTLGNRSLPIYGASAGLGLRF